MDERKRGMYVTARQKKKLIEFVAKHPELISCKVTQEFNYRDSQKLWQTIAHECNTLPGPGARKTWRQWRKTWQDLRSKTKRHAEIHGEVPSSAMMLTPAEQEALGLKNVSSTTNYQETTEFVQMDQDNSVDNYKNEMESAISYSEPESPPEVKVFTRSTDNKNKTKSSKRTSKHSDNCFLNCDLLATSEQRKIDLKEDYLNFKKDYLREKLKLMKEQTEALKSIARELTK
ncbi:uncharacterized protein LOC113516142 [Galleria mellonella]|uniref:Regulatory protein zeste n=1 Tax=Galleria mellonella TaxID=7137 RepID=A0A6J1WMU8_GALME|nr:uncharacterized protein LOC113516142 [Galleria mellonella]